jgi:hypothetical protein
MSLALLASFLRGLFCLFDFSATKLSLEKFRDGLNLFCSLSLARGHRNNSCWRGKLKMPRRRLRALLLPVEFLTVARPARKMQNAFSPMTMLLSS